MSDLILNDIDATSDILEDMKSIIDLSKQQAFQTVNPNTPELDARSQNCNRGNGRERKSGIRFGDHSQAIETAYKFLWEGLYKVKFIQLLQFLQELSGDFPDTVWKIADAELVAL